MKTSRDALAQHRVAGIADNEAILAFMAKQPMRAGLQLRFDRSPDFFALYGAQGENHEVHLLEEGPDIVGVASLVIRSSYICGVPRKIAYLCDLRIQPGRQRPWQWQQLFLQRMGQLTEEHGVDIALAAVLRDNHVAKNALQKKSRFGFSHFRAYNTISILARKPFRRPAVNDFSVRCARSDDIAALQSFLDAHARAQPFGVVFGEDELRQRLCHWPGLELNRFLLAESPAGDLLGCLAPWDYARLKRVVLDALPLSAEVLRCLLNLAAPFSGRPTIQNPPDALLPDVALTHVAIRQNRVDVFAALLRAAVDASFATRRCVTVSLCLFDKDPLWQALSDYWYHSVPMDLYTLGIGSECRNLLARVDLSPGFEFYLA